MDRILLVVFALIILPYAGIPNRYDIFIVLILVGFLFHSLYVFIKKHNLFSGKYGRKKQTSVPADPDGNSQDFEDKGEHDSVEEETEDEENKKTE